MRINENLINSTKMYQNHPKSTNQNQPKIHPNQSKSIKINQNQRKSTKITQNQSQSTKIDDQNRPKSTKMIVQNAPRAPKILPGPPKIIHFLLQQEGSGRCRRRRCQSGHPLCRVRTHRIRILSLLFRLQGLRAFLRAR